jgi:glycosyltransferase involved in cell wall biosynthesis
VRVLTLSYEFPPLGGGGSKVVHGLAAEFVRMGHEVDVVSMAYGDLPRFEEIQGIRVHRVPCLRRAVEICQPYEQASYMVRAFPRALRLAGRQPFDIMHCHFILPDGFVALLARRGLKIPLLVTAHGSDVPGYNPDRFKRLHQLISPAWRAAARSIDRIVCPSRYLEELVLKHEPRAQTTTIPNGFDVAKFSATRERRKSILVVTRMLERKGVQEVLRALAGTDMGFEVNVVGTGPYLKKLVELAGTLGLDIKFRGWLDNDSDELKELFETSAIFVLPSHAENFPLVLLEAMAAGTAIVTTDQTGCREVVGDAALLVPPRDERAVRNALQQLAADDALRDRLGREARNRLDRLFSWPAVARRYVDLFESLRSLDGQRVDAAETK